MPLRMCAPLLLLVNSFFWILKNWVCLPSDGEARRLSGGKGPLSGRSGTSVVGGRRPLRRGQAGPSLLN